jgi:DNA helicase-2/ATP-dependent DNA helicase PcrA
MFILPTDEQRLANLNRVRRWLAKVDGDPSWTSDDQESGVRILVVEHRMAASRLGFSDLYSAFKDEAPISLAESFRDGTAWPLKPFLDVLLPLASSFTQGNNFDVMNILRKFSPRLEHPSLRDNRNIGVTLSGLKSDIINLAKLLSSESKATVLDVLSFAYTTKLIMVDERFQDYISPTLSSEKENPQPISVEENSNADGEPEVNDQHLESLAIAKFLECPAVQLWGYQSYQLDLSRYATHQGVKGAEFRRVIVILDDDEGRHFQFSYEKLLGLKDPSKRDLENIKEGKDSVFERTRRLLYVCCSRATQDLVVVLYSENVDAALAHVKTNSIFESNEIYTLNSIP